MVQGDKLLDENLEHIGDTLEKPPGADTVGAETTLEVGTDLTLVEDVEERQHRVDQQQTDTDQHTLHGGREPGWHEIVEHRVEPGREAAEIIYCVITHDK